MYKLLSFKQRYAIDHILIEKTQKKYIEQNISQLD